LLAVERRTYRVSELTGLIRGVLEPSFSQVWVEGEVTQCRPAASGHLYFTLKDPQASLAAACFQGQRGGGMGGAVSASSGAWRAILREGQSVLCRGKLSVYPPRGTYQLIVDRVEPLGMGSLLLAFEHLKAKLAAEGLFRPELKRPLPRLPQQIAVVTSPTGAAIADLLTILKRRAPQVRVRIIPALVQGEEAPAHLRAGLELALRYRLGEVVVLARGGGSPQDLWCFNDESLARAIRASTLPVISAVGHEVDFTLADFVADLRAPTPSAAAELLSNGWVDARLQVQEAARRLEGAFRGQLAKKQFDLKQVSARLVSPRDRLREQAQRMDETQWRLERAMKMRLERWAQSIARSSAQLDALSPLRVLQRGYTLVRDPVSGSVVKSAQEVLPKQELEVTFHDGKRRVQVLESQTGGSG
jgi:exodeoxyribonuclease VII large subunit